MSFEINFPTDEEILGQKEAILQKSFPARRVRRLGFNIVFYQCRITGLISLLLYFILIFLCGTVRTSFENGGFIALAVFPLTYFCFYFLSLMSEAESGVIELKQSLRYSFMYLINLRMFYASIAAILLNLVLLMTCFKESIHIWSICAAGTTSMLLLALFSLVIYEKTGSAKWSGILLSGWVIGCLSLPRYGASLYYLFMEVIPLAVHIVAALVILGIFIGFIRRVEKQYAYSF